LNIYDKTTVSIGAFPISILLEIVQKQHSEIEWSPMTSHNQSPMMFVVRRPSV